jgi:hypothetical protein
MIPCLRATFFGENRKNREERFTDFELEELIFSLFAARVAENPTICRWRGGLLCYNQWLLSFLAWRQ